MMYLDFSAGGKDYKLRLTTRNTIALEKVLGMNPLSIFGDGETIPTVTTMVEILHEALQSLQHGISLNDTYDIVDAWLNDGHVITDFLPILVDLFKVSGLIKNDVEETEKN